MSETNYKVLKVKVSNFKNIKDLEVTLEGKSVFIIGDNALGKTSLIQAIFSTLSNKKAPKQPIMQGAEEASVMIIIGNDGKEYKIEKTFAGEKETLQITSPDGFKTSKVGNLETLIGDINFDILKFVDLSNSVPGRREQVKMIRQFIPEEQNKRIDAINEGIKLCEEERTEINKDITKLKTKTATTTFSEDVRDKYKEPIVVTEVMAKLDEANKANAKVGEAEKERGYQNIEADKLKQNIKTLQEQLKDKESKIEQLNKQLEVTKRIETKVFEDSIKDSEVHNTKVKEIVAFDKDVADLEVLKTQYANRKEKIVELTENKNKIVSECKLPVDGLTFNEEGLMLNGVTLDETQQSTSELMKIGVELAMAKNPNCRIIRVDRSESLGTDKLEQIMALAKEKDYQIFFEEVQRGQEELMIKVVEA